MKKNNCNGHCGTDEKTGHSMHKNQQKPMTSGDKDNKNYQNIKKDQPFSQDKRNEQMPKRDKESYIDQNKEKSNQPKNKDYDQKKYTGK